MPITVQHAPAAATVGGAALMGGYGQFAHRRDQFNEENQRFDENLGIQQQQLDERARQFDEQLDFRQQGQQIQQDQFGQQLNFQRQSRAINVYEAANERQARLFSQSIAEQSRMAYGQQQAEYQQQMQQERLGFEGWRQEQIGERQDAQLKTQVQWRREQQLAQQMDRDWAAIQKSLPMLDDAARESLIDQFTQKYEGSNLPMPIEPPTKQMLPPEMDPLANLKRLQGQFPDAAFYLNNEGEIMAPRGFNPLQLKSHIEQEWTREDDRFQREIDYKLEVERSKVEQEKLKIKYEQQKQALSNRTEFFTSVAKARAEGQKLFAGSSDGLTAFDKGGYESYMQDVTRDYAAAYGIELPEGFGGKPSDETAGGGETIGGGTRSDPFVIDDSLSLPQAQAAIKASGRAGWYTYQGETVYLEPPSE